ncbi:MAG: diacylglycerol kinase [Paracoccus denitrificans]|nr:MAG: diacylglycerol kinase [Paracoccus denitrificans]PZO84170.1 MAG: diacylglycerol kinase [Paracoccus denitrificans]
MADTDLTPQPFDLSKARVCAILNGGSGKQKSDDLAALLDRELGPYCGTWDLRQTKRGRDIPVIARQAVQRGFDLIVAAGGDGTQAAVAGALAEKDVLMGVIPGGTFNYFARDLGVGETPEQAIATLRNARLQSISVGRIGRTVFLNNVSFGAYPQILKTRESIYRRWGRSRVAAYWSVLKTLVNLRNPMSVSLNTPQGTKTHRSTLIFVAKSAYQLDNFGLAGAEAVRAGHFAVFIARASRPAPLIMAAVRLAVGKSRDDDFDMIIADEMVIETTPARQLVAHDGEKTKMRGPFDLQVLKGGLTVLVPVESETARGSAVTDPPKDDPDAPA